MAPAAFLMGVGLIARRKKASLPKLPRAAALGFSDELDRCGASFHARQVETAGQPGCCSLWIVTTVVVNIFERVKSTSGQFNVRKTRHANAVITVCNWPTSASQFSLLE